MLVCVCVCSGQNIWNVSQFMFLSVDIIIFFHPTESRSKFVCVCVLCDGDERGHTIFEFKKEEHFFSSSMIRIAMCV